MKQFTEKVKWINMKIYSEDVLESALKKAGFKDFQAFINDENDWICVTARKA